MNQIFSFPLKKKKKSKIRYPQILFQRLEREKKNKFKSTVWERKKNKNKMRLRRVGRNVDSERVRV